MHIARMAAAPTRPRHFMFDTHLSKLNSLYTQLQIQHKFIHSRSINSSCFLVVVLLLARLYTHTHAVVYHFYTYKEIYVHARSHSFSREFISKYTLSMFAVNLFIVSHSIQVCCLFC